MVYEQERSCGIFQVEKKDAKFLAYNGVNFKCSHQPSKPGFSS